MSYAVFFDVLPKEGYANTYFGMAGELKPIVDKSPGFISVERFENLASPGWFLSFSQWADEDALKVWRTQRDHYQAQLSGKNLILGDYRLRVGKQIEAKGLGAGKVAIAAILGNLSSVREIVRSIKIRKTESPRMFRGVINQDRAIALYEDQDTINVINSLDGIDANGEFEVQVFAIQRDYGMTDRAQAPQAI
jgi:heme-degrading monooxygenase HmoA